MKFGLICEGVQDGADEQMLRCLIRRLKPDLDFVIVALGNKPTLKRECGRATHRLLTTDGCVRVGILWDLFPKWGDDDNDCDTDEADIRASLDAAEVDTSKVELLCVIAELETWLLFDHKAIEAAITRPVHPVTVSRIKKPMEETHPKDRLRKLFERKKVRRYQEHYHNIRIAQHADLDRLRQCPSFADFELRVLP